MAYYTKPPYVAQEFKGVSASSITFDIPYQNPSDIEVHQLVNGEYTPISAWTINTPRTIPFGNTVTGDFKVVRNSDITSLKATFQPGSAIRAQDLNANFTQLIYALQENAEDFDQLDGYLDDNYLRLDGTSVMAGDIQMGTNKIKDLKYPEVVTDAASVQYVLDRISELPGGDGNAANLVSVAPISLSVDSVQNKTTISLVISTIEKEIK